MKSSIFLTILAFAVACVFACRPEGSNEPQCDNSNLNKPIRNFWNSDRYWFCQYIGVKANSIRCPDDHAFDEDRKKCVLYREWKWTQPCSKANAEVNADTGSCAKTCNEACLYACAQNNENYLALIDVR